MEQMRDWMKLFTGTSLIDLSHTLEEEMPVYPTHSRYFHTKWDSFDTGSAALVGQLLINEHCGTHMDATGHFLQEGHPEHRYMAETPLSNCLGRAVTLDFAHYTDKDLVSAEEMEAWEQANGAIEPGDIVLFRFGWDRYWAPRNVDRSYTANWPGLSGAAAEYLVSRRIKAVGCDTLAIDGSHSSGNPAHYALLGSGVNIFENLKGLDRVLGESFFIGLPLKIKGGSGSPVRAVALVPEAAGS